MINSTVHGFLANLLHLLIGIELVTNTNNNIIKINHAFYLSKYSFNSLSVNFGIFSCLNNLVPQILELQTLVPINLVPINIQIYTSFLNNLLPYIFHRKILLQLPI